MRKCIAFAIVSTLALGLLSVTALHAAERKPARNDGPQWPNVAADEGPQWPKISNADTRFPTAPARSAMADLGLTPAPGPTPAARNAGALASAGAQWPKAPNPPNAEPAPQTFAARAALADLDITASTEPRRSAFARAEPIKPFVFETGLRYWYSSGSTYFAFANGNPNFGDPTSTLDWRDMRGHSGEVFARLDHKPTGLFVKGLIGHGLIRGGNMVDRDFVVDQFTFSDTNSDVKGNGLTYAIADVGYAFSPMPGMQFGVFAGYHYWREKVSAHGLICNRADIQFCPVGVLQVGFDTPVIQFETTRHALRLGLEAKMTFAERWSFSVEVAGVPYVTMKNNDSHFLRTDLGPSPNVVSVSKKGFGVEAEAVVGYALTPTIELGAGVRYWHHFTDNGHNTFGPAFANTMPLREFAQQRFGVFLQVSGKF